MHAMWKGTIQIAKIQIPIKLYAATEDKEISLRQIHEACGGPISHLKYCQACETRVETDAIRKAYDLGGGNLVELAEDELEAIAPQASKTFVVEQFADEAKVGRIRLKKHYYVGTDELGEDAFRLLHAGLLREKKAGIGYITLRSAQSLAAIWPAEEGLVLSTMLYEDEIRQMDRIAAPSNRVRERVPEDHAFAFRQLILAMSGEYAGAKYPNRYDESLRMLIQRKIAKLPTKERPADEPAAIRREGNMEELLSALTASLDYAQSGSGAFASPEEGHTH
ncbi:Ku protein [Paenibacillaceae bacterium WGS1546]|uniref:non-homologous end joining protein Ku n=1 Tax=Cohnella sp. WGS1546 TaxID=3366810 RepID=UPI00372D7D1A